MSRPIPLRPTLALLLALAACQRKPDEPPGGRAALADLPAAAPGGTAAAPMPDEPQDTSDPIRFQPLRSTAVKDAIHRALQTGRTQRWADGALTGYAVPSAQTDANGCRAVRYTVDQRTGAPADSINACDAH